MSFSSRSAAARETSSTLVREMPAMLPAPAPAPPVVAAVAADRALEAPGMICEMRLTKFCGSAAGWGGGSEFARGTAERRRASRQVRTA